MMILGESNEPQKEMYLINILFKSGVQKRYILPLASKEIVSLQSAFKNVKMSRSGEPGSIIYIGSKLFDVKDMDMLEITLIQNNGDLISC